LEKLDPEVIKFKRPDFGFNDKLTFDDLAEEGGWKKFMDCVSMEPQNQRVQNYIDFIHQKKISLIKLPTVS
jgi:hypothetical protein